MKIILLLILACIVLLGCLAVEFYRDSRRWRRAYRKRLVERWPNSIPDFILRDCADEAWLDFGIWHESPTGCADDQITEWHRICRIVAEPGGEQRLVDQNTMRVRNAGEK